jgi:cysteine synthase A
LNDKTIGNKMKIASTITDLIGGTPLLRLPQHLHNTDSELLAKLEFQNPGASVKDRLAWAMIEHGEKEGLIQPETTIIEPTSGNTGVGLAMVCAARAYKLIVTMPAETSVERRLMIEAFGGRVVLTDADAGMQGAIARAEEIAAGLPSSYIPYQFRNSANAAMHYRTTGPEIWEDSGGAVDIFIAGVGTGGTISGAGRFLKEKNRDVKVVAVEPAASPVLSGGMAGKHKIAGIGAGFIPEVLERDVIDEIITVSDDEARQGAREMARSAGVLAGVSSGAIFHAAVALAQRQKNEAKKIVFITCDTGERYLSTSLFRMEAAK